MASVASEKLDKVALGGDDAPARLSSLLPCPGTPLPANFDSLPLLNRTQVSSRIAAGQLLVVHPPLVYKIPTAWLNMHPGGDLAILHYVGRDATNEIEAYHTGKTVKERMARWVVGKVEVDEKEGWRDMVPPVQMSMWPLPVPTITVSSPTEKADEAATPVKATTASADVLTPAMVDPPCPPREQMLLTPSYQHHLRQSLRHLYRRLQSLDLDTPPPHFSGYAPLSLSIYTSLALLTAYLYFRAQTSLDFIAAGVALGLFWHQLTFVAHDAGHTGITGDWWTDRLIGIGIANFIGGMSLGWWADNHNVHHCMFDFRRQRA